MERGNTIGSRIETLRTKKGLTQAALAKEMGVKRETVVQWESNTRDLKTAATIKLADFFNVTCDYILRGIAAENVDVYRELGLTDEAIETLKYAKMHKSAWIEYRGMHPKIFHWSDILSLIIEHTQYFPTAIYCLEDLLNNDYINNMSDIEEDIFDKAPEVLGMLKGKAFLLQGYYAEQYLRSEIAKDFESLIKVVVSKAHPDRDNWNSYESSMKYLRTRSYNGDAKRWIAFAKEQAKEGGEPHA